MSKVRQDRAGSKNQFATTNCAYNLNRHLPRGGRGAAAHAKKRGNPRAARSVGARREAAAQRCRQDRSEHCAHQTGQGRGAKYTCSQKKSEELRLVKSGPARAITARGFETPLLLPRVTARVEPACFFGSCELAVSRSRGARPGAVRVGDMTSSCGGRPGRLGEILTQHFQLERNMICKGVERARARERGERARE